MDRAGANSSEMIFSKIVVEFDKIHSGHWHVIINGQEKYSLSITNSWAADKVFHILGRSWVERILIFGINVWYEKNSAEDIKGLGEIMHTWQQKSQELPSLTEIYTVRLNKEGTILLKLLPHSQPFFF